MDEEDFNSSVRQLFLDCLSYCGINHELWTMDKKTALDTYIDDTSITTMVVYVDSKKELKVEFSEPSEDLYVSRALGRAGRITADPSHPGRGLFEPLPTGVHPDQDLPPQE